MFEKVNPAHPDKVADRIAGAIVDLAYKVEENPKIAVEVLIGHGVCHIIAESSVDIDKVEVCKAVHRIAKEQLMVDFKLYPQDKHLADNQKDEIRCGDNGIFKGIPLTTEQKQLSALAKEIYKIYGTDGKYVLDGDKIIICQSHAEDGEISMKGYSESIVNPLGYWEGGLNTDTGATNRKLGSDMADSVTGGGLHGKDLSKADVSVNIYAFLKAQELNEGVIAGCAIGDTHIDGIPYSEIVETAREYIKSVGGFEKFAEWGLV
jgi:S-adenosylmethionine synthetase